MTNTPEAQFEKKRLETLYRQHSSALTGNLLVSVCVVILFWHQVPLLLLISWFIAMAGVILARFFIIHQYKSQEKDTVPFQKWFLKIGISTTANGLLWGIIGLYAYYNVPLIYFSILLIILTGLVAAAVGTNALSIPIFFGFTLSIMLPVSLSLLISGKFEYIVLGALTVGYLGFMVQSALQSNKVILKSMRLGYENLQLLDDLQKEKSQVMNLNEQLSHDIEKHKQTEKEREHLIQELQKALHEIKTLSGLIPICANCKKVRDDKGYWSQIESYIHEHSDADFSHGICPDCAKKLYPDMDLYSDKSSPG